MKYFFLIILIPLFFNCNHKDDIECQLKSDVFYEIINNAKIKEFLHPEIESRIPVPIQFNTKDDNNCIINNDYFFFINTKNNLLSDNKLEVLRYEVKDNEIKLSLFYKIEGVNITCHLIKNVAGKIMVKSIYFVEI